MDYPNLIFSQLSHAFQTEITVWNVMIRGYAYNGHFEECVGMFDEMPHRGLRPDNYTYPYVLSSCCEMGFPRKGLNVHCQIVKSGFGSSFAVSHSLFHMYDKIQTRFHKLTEARKVFDEMSAKPVQVWNRMIYQCATVGSVVAARELFDKMPRRDVVSWNSMISGFVKVGEIENAKTLFEKMPERNVVSWTIMIRAFADAGDLKTSIKFFEKMPFKNVVSWNSMISGYNQHRRFEEALDLFVKMQSKGIPFDGYTIVSVLSACANLGALEFGTWVHSMIEDWTRLGVIVGTALIDMYAKCGDMDGAFSLFIKIGTKDVFCWNVMIKSLAIHGRSQDAIKIFSLMLKNGLRPNDFTLTATLFACSHGGLVKEGREIFCSIERDFGISPKLEHFSCLVDLLSRYGELEEAQILVESMPFKPDIAIWGALLGGCRIRNDLKLAEEVIEKASDMDANESGVHVLLSNIHASVGHWPDALRVRKTMEEKKIWKKAGYSLLQENFGPS